MPAAASRPHARSLLLALAVVACVLAAATPARAAGCAGAHTTRAGASRLAQAVVCEINRVRAQHGLRRVTLNDALATAARRYARSMAKRNFFSHVSPDGSTLVDRLRRVGYARPGTAWALGECIGWATSSLATPAAMVRAWMHSPPHRAIILTGAYRNIGAGVAGGLPVRGVGGSGATYVADFGVRH
jgi:uncharacterized protein YkwD